MRPGVVYVLEASLDGEAGGAAGAPANPKTGEAGAGQAEAWALLPNDERARADRVKDPGTRRRFVTGRACLRSALALLTNTNARDLRFNYGKHGKPFLPGGPSFSVSHSGERLLIALAAGGRVGVDVERIRPVRRLRAVAARWLAPGERAWLAAGDEAGADADAAFFAVWTRKEAVAKALGSGLATSFRSFSVDMSASEGGDGCGGGLADLAVSGERADDWTVTGLIADPGVVAAVAADWRDAEVERRIAIDGVAANYVRFAS